MILGNKAIQQELKAGNIIIDPFNPDQLQTGSYDVTLGDFVYFLQEIKDGKQAYSFYNLASKGIKLSPGACYLAHTKEYIGGRNNIITKLQARSTIARHFLSICSCGGWGDVGYISRWTLELKNNSNHTIHLHAGDKIGQIIFMRVEGVEGDYSDKGSYQTTTDIEKIKADWKPESMIPKTNLFI